MIISPLPKHRCPIANVAVILKNGFTIDSTGHVSSVEQCSAPVIYCDSPLRAIDAARRIGGTALVSKTRGGTRWLRFEVAGRRIYPGVGFSIEALTGFAEYCAELGIYADSLQVMAFNLMRHTLAGFVDVAEGGMVPFNKFPPGARMHSKPGVYKHCLQFDLTAAYLWSIGQINTAQRLNPINRIHVAEVADTPGAFAFVSVRNSETRRHGPVPAFNSEGVTFFPTKREWSDFCLLPAASVRLAMDEGCEIRLRKAWLPYRQTSTPFFAFVELIRELRGKPYGKVAKRAGNTLWGTFSASSETSIITFVPGNKRHSARKLPPRAPKCPPIAANVTAAIRSRVFREGMSPHTVQVHTDGLIVPSHLAPVGLAGKDGEPGDWRIDREFSEVEILDSAWWSGTDATGATLYKTAGRPGSARVFEHRKIAQRKADHRGMFS